MTLQIAKHVFLGSTVQLKLYLFLKVLVLLAIIVDKELFLQHLLSMKIRFLSQLPNMVLVQLVITVLLELLNLSNVLLVRLIL